MAEPDDSIIFVVDGKTLEVMSLLLAASLANTHDTKNEVQVIAYVSERSQRDISDATQKLYVACNVRIEPLPSSDGIWAKSYPHGNKLLACRAKRSSKRTVFLDTDMVCLGKITGLVSSDSEKVCVVPEGLPTWGKEGDAWERAYAFADVPMPSERVQLTRGRRISYLPYFNAGFVSFSDSMVDFDGKNFGELWFDMAHEFDWKCAIAKKRPWLDQITLPLTLAKHKIPFTTLDETFNYSVSERVRMGKTRKAKVLHYHKAVYFAGLPQAKDILHVLRDRCPIDSLSEIDNMLKYFTDAQAPGVTDGGVST